MSEEEDYYNNEESFDDYETRYSFDDVIRTIERNSRDMTEINVGDKPVGWAINEVYRYEAGYVSLEDGSYSDPLGDAIATNTQLKTLRIKGGYGPDGIDS